MFVNAWRATLEMESIATVWACVRTVLCLEGWGRMNEQIECLMICASLPSSCEAAIQAVLLLSEKSGRGMDPNSGSPRHLSFLIF